MALNASLTLDIQSVCNKIIALNWDFYYAVDPDTNENNDCLNKTVIDPYYNNNCRYDYCCDLHDDIYFPYEQNAGILYKDVSKLNNIHNAVMNMAGLYPVRYGVALEKSLKYIPSDNDKVLCAILDDLGYNKLYKPVEYVIDDNDYWLDQMNSILDRIEYYWNVPLCSESIVSDILSIYNELANVEVYDSSSVNLGCAPYGPEDTTCLWVWDLQDLLDTMVRTKAVRYGMAVTGDYVPDSSADNQWPTVNEAYDIIGYDLSSDVIDCSSLSTIASDLESYWKKVWCEENIRDGINERYESLGKTPYQGCLWPWDLKGEILDLEDYFVEKLDDWFKDPGAFSCLDLKGQLSKLKTTEYFFQTKGHDDYHEGYSDIKDSEIDFYGVFYIGSGGDRTEAENNYSFECEGTRSDNHPAYWLRKNWYGMRDRCYHDGERSSKIITFEINVNIDLPSKVTHDIDLQYKLRNDHEGKDDDQDLLNIGYCKCGWRNDIFNSYGTSFTAGYSNSWTSLETATSSDYFWESSTYGTNNLLTDWMLGVGCYDTDEEEVCTGCDGGCNGWELSTGFHVDWKFTVTWHFTI